MGDGTYWQEGGLVVDVERISKLKPGALIRIVPTQLHISLLWLVSEQRLVYWVLV